MLELGWAAALLAGPLALTILYLWERRRLTESQGLPAPEQQAAVLDRLYRPQEAPTLRDAQGFYGANLTRPLGDETVYPESAARLREMPMEEEAWPPESVVIRRRKPRKQYVTGPDGQRVRVHVAGEKD